MLATEATKIGKKGVFVIPARLRQQFGLEEGALMMAEATEQGILLRPATVLPLEIYNRERQAEFLLHNAVDAVEYNTARQEIIGMGLNPDTIPQ